MLDIDRGGIGRGMTARTTGHLATELDDFNAELIIEGLPYPPMGG